MARGTTVPAIPVFALAAFVAAVVLGSRPATACNCPKEFLVKKYGSVSQLHRPTDDRPASEAGQVPAPEPPQAPPPAGSGG